MPINNYNNTIFSEKNQVILRGRCPPPQSLPSLARDKGSGFTDFKTQKLSKSTTKASVS